MSHLATYRHFVVTDFDIDTTMYILYIHKRGTVPLGLIFEDFMHFLKK